jgi:hypothetical protein
MPAIITTTADDQIVVRRQRRDVGWTGKAYEAWCEPCGFHFTSPNPHHLTPAVDAISLHNRTCPHVNDPAMYR